MPGQYQRPGPPPQAAIDYLRRKGYKTVFDYREVWKEQHARAFTVAKVLEGDILVDIRKAVDQALADGVPLAEFKKRLEPTLAKRGWIGYGELIDPKSGDSFRDLFGNPQEFELGTPRRLKTIYDTNLRQSRGAGQWVKVQETKAVLPFLRYTLGPSREHRQEHSAWSDLVLSVDDPFWDTHYPINGWGCKCRVIPITKRKAAKLGGPHQAPKFERFPWVNRETKQTEMVPEGIDPGFDYNPGKAGGKKIIDIAKQKKATVIKVVGTKKKPAPLPS